MFDVQARTCAFESARQKGWAVISHHALDAHAQPLVESTNGVEKDQRRALLLVGQNLRTRHPRAIIHGDKDVFITYPAHAICALAGDPMAHPRYARKLLDIDMHKFSWSIFLIAYNRHRGFQTGQPMQSTRTQPATHTCRAQPYTCGNLRIRQTLSAQLLNAPGFTDCSSPGQSHGSRAAVDQSANAFTLKSRSPLRHRAPR
jgi:hypothetical protein